jgi:hypothetical protein
MSSVSVYLTKKNIEWYKNFFMKWKYEQKKILIQQNDEWLKK